MAMNATYMRYRRIIQSSKRVVNSKESCLKKVLDIGVSCENAQTVVPPARHATLEIALQSVSELDRFVIRVQGCFPAERTSSSPGQSAIP